MLLTGPDLLTDLFGLLVRFREYPVAVSADIAKIFHQVRVPERDQSMLQFLWRQPGSNEPLRQLQMTVHIFGAICSPAVCTYVLRKSAEDHKEQFPHVWRKVTSNFYVDNYLDSFASANEATSSCQQLTQLLSRGRFHLTKWISSSRSVLKTVKHAEVEELQLKWAGHTHATQTTLDDLVIRSRDLKRLLHVVASVFRFAGTCLSDRTQRRNGPFSVAELDRAFAACLASAQREC
ncbi:hypothetical protein M513_10604 [Trichuris suis]|uniref:Reverse transcriptase domain-containing protein n=1 Tax=Trichuris suis TaxID=68888 RepID=A0A085LU81_9BILA|nr:hypothetical protein M513_10604 [Trichuris suis]